MKIIFLTGYMGVGKTYIGKLIAQRFNTDFIDIDDKITKSIGIPIANFLTKETSDEFREREYLALKEVINSAQSSLIVSLGGGALINNKTLKLVKKSGYLIWIKRPLKYLETFDYVDRPLAQSDNLYHLYGQRLKGYTEADYTIELDLEHDNSSLSLLYKQIEKILLENA